MKEHVLKKNEYHPSADNAMKWLKEYQVKYFKDWIAIKESIFSCAISGNRLAEILSSTINRLDKGQFVSDRYLLGLAWFLKESQENKNQYIAGEDIKNGQLLEIKTNGKIYPIINK